jgi:hypothetical protein
MTGQPIPPHPDCVPDALGIGQRDGLLGAGTTGTRSFSSGCVPYSWVWRCTWRRWTGDEGQPWASHSSNEPWVFRQEHTPGGWPWRGFFRDGYKLLHLGYPWPGPPIRSGGPHRQPDVQ